MLTKFDSLSILTIRARHDLAQFYSQYIALINNYQMFVQLQGMSRVAKKGVK